MLFRSGTNIRDWIHVNDNCAAIHHVLQSGEIGEIYNIGAGNEISNLELTQMLLDLCELDESRVIHVKDRPGHDFRYSVDSRKLRDLGWSPQIDLEAGLAETVDWYRENETWWRPKKAGQQ